MVFVTFASGFMPGIIRSPKIINIVAIIGGGFLMGAALVIVLPESVKALVDSNPKIKDSEVFPDSMIYQIGLSVLGGFYVMLLFDEAFAAYTSHIK